MQWLWLRNNLEQMFQASMSTLWEKKKIIIIIIFFIGKILLLIGPKFLKLEKQQ